MKWRIQLNHNTGISFAFWLLLINFPAFAQPKIAPLLKRDIEYGCGCSFHIPFERGAKGRQILQWEMESPAKMRVDGKLHKLKVAEIRPKALRVRPERVGDKTIFNLTGPGFSVRAVCVADAAAHGFYERLGFSFVEERDFGDDHCYVYRLARDHYLDSIQSVK